MFKKEKTNTKDLLMYLCASVSSGVPGSAGFSCCVFTCFGLIIQMRADYVVFKRTSSPIMESQARGGIDVCDGG